MITTGRSLTIKDGDMGLAMLTGDKRMETRKRKLAKGWYNLHLGKQAKTNAAGSLIGMIHVGRIVDCNLLEDTWAKPEFGQFASVIDKSVEFATPIGPISGGQGVWYIKDQEVMRRLEEQLQGADCRNFGEYRADLPDLSAPEKKTIYKPWTKAKQNKNTRQCRKKKTSGLPVEVPDDRRMQKRTCPRKRKWHPASMPSNQPASLPAPDGNVALPTEGGRKSSKSMGTEERGTGEVLAQCNK